MNEHFEADHIHTTPEGRHFRHGDGAQVDGEGEPMTDTYRDHTIEILTDASGYFARIDGHDEPLADDLPEGATEADALAEARLLVDRRWF